MRYSPGTRVRITQGLHTGRIVVIDRVYDRYYSVADPWLKERLSGLWSDATLERAEVSASELFPLTRDPADFWKLMVKEREGT